MTDVSNPPDMGDAPSVLRIGDDTGGSGNGAHSNWLWHKIQSYFPDPAVTTDSAADQLFESIDSSFEPALADLETAMTSAWDALKALMSDPQDFKTLGVSDVLDCFHALIDAGLNLADAVAVDMLNIASYGLNNMSTLTSVDLEIPFVGKLLEIAGVDPAINLGRALSLLIMFPATLAHQLKYGVNDPLFPSTAQVDPYHPPQLGDHLHDSLAIASAAIQGAWALLDTSMDLMQDASYKGLGPVYWLFAGADAAFPLALQILGWPGAPNADGSTAEPFATAPQLNDANHRFLFSWWVLGNAIAPVSITSALCSNQSSLARFETWVPWVGMGVAVVEMIFGTIALPLTGGSGGAIAANLLGNISNAVGPFLTKEVKDITDETSVPVKLLIDVFCGAGAAIALGFS